MALAPRSSFQLTALALALASIGAAAAPINWATDTSGNWSLPINWSPIGLPDSSSDVTIVLTGVKTITHDVGNDTIHTLTFNATAPNPNATLLVTNGSSLTVNAGGTNGSVVRADNGTVSFNGGTLLNLGILNAINSGTISVSNGAVIQGGTLSTASSGQVVLSGSAVLDGATAGSITNAGTLNVTGGQTAFFAGSIVNNGAITVGGNADFRGQTGNATFSGTGTIAMTDVNSRLFANSGSDTLTFGSGQTVSGQGQIGLNQSRIVNAGVIAASGGTLSLDPTDGAGNFVNTGTLRAQNGGTLQFLAGTYTNAGANISALAGSTVNVINNAIVSGGTVSTAGNGTVNFAAGSVLDGATNGTLTLTGNVNVVGGQTAYALGTINDNNLTVGANADLRAQGANNLTFANNGTLTLTDINTRLFGDNGTNVITNTAGNTIQGIGQIGVNQTVLVNNGLITSNAGGNINLDPVDGAGGFLNTGTIRAENGSSVLFLAGTYRNNGALITATTGNSAITVTNGAIIQGGTLTASAGSSINFTGSAVLDGLTHGAINANGNVTVVGGQTAYALGTINDNNLMVGGNADLRAQGTNNLTFANNGTLTLTDVNTRLFGDNGNNVITNTAGNTIQGTGQIGVNSAVIVNNGVITSNAGGNLQLDPRDGAGGFLNTGTIRAENGGSVQFLAGTYQNNGALITATGSSAIGVINGAIVQGGTLTAAAGSSISFGASAVLDGLTHGAISTNGNVNVVGGQTAYALGTINDNSLSVGGNADLRAQGANNLTFANNGTLTLTDINTRLFGDIGTNVITNTAGNTIQGVGQIGVNSAFLVNTGLITANVSGQTLQFDPTDGTSTDGGLINTGTIRAENGGNVNLFFAHYNNAGGTISAMNGSSITVTNGAVIEGGTLTTAGTGGITLFGSSVLDGAAHGTLTNTGAITIQPGQTGYFTGVLANNGTITVGGNADWRVQGTSNATINGTGTVTLSDQNTRIFGDTGNLLTIGAGQTVQGQGQFGANSLAITNAGTIAANTNGNTLNVFPSSALNNQTTGTLLASNSGTLNLQSAVTGTGTIRSDSNGTVIVGQSSTTGNLVNNAFVSLGTSNVTVSADYNNANFGTGNSFNKRTNVSGTGQILASGNVAQAITGANVTNGTTGTPTLTIGNVRVGGTTYNYQVANTGTAGPSIRGAIENAVNGGNITDSRLSGNGVTASNYGPVAVGTNSGDRAVTFTVSSAGMLAPLNGQTVHVANNFDNLSEQTLSLALASGAAAYNAAIGSATPTSVTFGNVRVNTPDSQTFTVKNTQTASAFSEDLNAAFGATSGVTATGSITGLVAGGTNSSALSAALDTSSAGAKTGSVTINYATAGTVNGVSNGLGTLAIGSQTIALSGNVYNAAVGSTTPSPVTVANQRVNGSNSSALTVANTAAAGNFSEALNASFGGTTGTATSNGGSFTNLAAGSSNVGTLAVGVNTMTAGAKSGSVTVAYQTEGTGSNGHSGLSAASAGSQTVSVSGNVYQAAAGNIVTAPLNFGTVQVGQMGVGTNVVIQNTATGAAGFVEDLNASFGAATGTGANHLTATGSVNGLVAGATSNALAIGINTSSAGTVNASIAVNYVSAGTVGGVSNGLGTLSVGSQGYGVMGTINGTANVVDQASPVINNAPIALGNVRLGATSPTGTVSVTNVASGNQQAALNASIAGNAPVTASGSFNLLNPGATNNSSLVVGIDTTSAGNKSGTATISFVSDASNIGNCAPNCQMTLAPQNVAVTGAVYRLANPAATPSSVTVAGRVNSASPTTALTVTNVSPDIYTEGLSVTRGATSAGFTSTGSITNLAAGNSSGAIGVTLDTMTAGTFSGTQALNYVSTGAGTTGAADMSVGSGIVTLNGKVYAPAAAALNTPSVAFGIVHVNDTVTQQSVSVTNSAATTALNDVLVASASSATGPFTASGNLGAGLASQATSTALKVGLNTATAGVYSGSAAFSAASHDADLSDVALANLAVGLTGQVNNYATDAFVFGSGAGSLTQSGSTFILDYGTVMQGSGTRSTTLVADNAATGPADLLDGVFQFLDPADFAESGFASFANLAAGQSTGALMLSFSAMTVGSFMDTITLHGVGHNASGYSASIGDIQLIVRGAVTGQVVPPPPPSGVPEPDSLLLLGLGIPLLFLRRGRKHRQPTVH